MSGDDIVLGGRTFRPEDFHPWAFVQTWTPFFQGVMAEVAAAQAARVAVAADRAAVAAAINDAAGLPTVATGATTPRTAADRAAEVVSVLDFDAVGDGVHDDTAAIRAALVAAQGSAGGERVVVFPAGGKYTWDSPTPINLDTLEPGGGAGGVRVRAYGATIVNKGAAPMFHTPLAQKDDVFDWQGGEVFCTQPQGSWLVHGDAVDAPPAYLRYRIADVRVIGPADPWSIAAEDRTGKGIYINGGFGSCTDVMVDRFGSNVEFHRHTACVWTRLRVSAGLSGLTIRDTAMGGNNVLVYPDVLGNETQLVLRSGVQLTVVGGLLESTRQTQLVVAGCVGLRFYSVAFDASAPTFARFDYADDGVGGGGASHEIMFRDCTPQAAARPTTYEWVGGWGTRPAHPDRPLVAMIDCGYLSPDPAPPWCVATSTGAAGTRASHGAAVPQAYAPALLGWQGVLSREADLVVWPHGPKARVATVSGHSVVADAAAPGGYAFLLPLPGGELTATYDVGTEVPAGVYELAVTYRAVSDTAYLYRMVKRDGTLVSEAFYPAAGTAYITHRERVTLADGPASLFFGAADHAVHIAQMVLRPSFGSLLLGGARHDRGSAAPSAGQGVVGDIRWHATPTDGVLGWVCTASGTPGTWEPIPLGDAGSPLSAALDGTYVLVEPKVAGQSLALLTGDVNSGGSAGEVVIRSGSNGAGAAGAVTVEAGAGSARADLSLRAKAGNVVLRTGAGGDGWDMVYSQTAATQGVPAGSLIPNGSNTLAIGASGNTVRDVYLTNAPTVLSDERLKNEVSEVPFGVDFVDAVRPVSYRLDGGVRRHFGFLAQEVRQQLGSDQYAAWVLADPADPDSRQMLRSEELVPVLWRAVQELAARVRAVEGEGGV